MAGKPHGVDVLPVKIAGKAVGKFTKPPEIFSPEIEGKRASQALFSTSAAAERG